jgi:outer membrane protein OmpA-like peptidoglycan-associated protein
MLRKIIAFVILVMMLSSCQLISDYVEQFLTDKIMEAVTADQPPPPGYDPNFISKIEPISSNDIEDPSIEISRIDDSDPNNIKMYVHLIDNNQTYLTGAAEGSFKDIWCTVYDTTDTGEITVKDLKITERTSDDKPPLSTTIVMDLSGSMGNPRAKRMQQGVKDFIEKKDSQDRIGLVRYDNKIDKQLSPTSNKSTILNNHQIVGLDGFGGGTETLLAIDAGLDITESEEDDRYKSIIVFTDGQSNYTQGKMDDIIKRARDKKVIINTVDYGYNVVEGKLEYIANETSGIYHHIYTQDEFEPLFADLYNRIKNSYVIEYSPSAYGKHNIGLELCLKDQNIIATAEFDNTPKAGEISLLDVNFDTAKSLLKPTEEIKVKNLLLLMEANPDMEIELQGHTDDRGDDQMNMSLSQDRADSVKDYLIKNGISSDRITAIGYGETQPIASNNTEIGRAKNRRTQFKVTKK